jgi:hypothetical protein
MRDDGGELPDYLAGSEHYDPNTPMEELEERITAMEGRIDELEAGHESSKDGGVAAYVLGMSLAVVLSWSRNSSILWCILHGILSWIYVIYFAVTR